jgi:hypothetical protein
MNVTVLPDGQLRFVVTKEARILGGLGRMTTRRASHVVPQNHLLRVLFRLLRSCVSDDSRCAGWTRRWHCRWLADLRISGGPVLGPYAIRQQAIVQEVDWLHTHGF